MPTHIFKAKMTCDGCKNSIQKVLDKQKANGIDNVEINLAEQLVKVTTKLSQEQVLEMIKKTGKEVEYVSTS